MKYTLLDGARPAPAWWSRAGVEVDGRALFDEVQRDAERALAADDDPDFSEEFGPGHGFAGGSGFRYGEFDLWV